MAQVQLSIQTKAQNHAGPEDTVSSSGLFGYQACMQCIYTYASKELICLKYPLLFMDGFYNHRSQGTVWHHALSATPIFTEFSSAMDIEGHQQSRWVQHGSSAQEGMPWNTLEAIEANENTLVAF